jgi:hypothetical protein
MDQKEFSKARADLVSAMTRLLLEVDSEEALAKIVGEAVPEAVDGYVAELNAVIKRRQQTETKPMLTHWQVVKKLAEFDGNGPGASAWLLEHKNQLPESFKKQLADMLAKRGG